MMRSHGWDRDLPKRIQNKLRNENQINEFDSLYTFYLPGFNLRSTDLQAFIGLRAIDKLDDYTKKRNKNFQIYKSSINNNQLSITDNENNFISNFAYPIVSKNRSLIIQKLIENDIEVRPLIAGDMSKKPMWIKNYGEVTLPNCQLINEYGFYIPNHQDLTSEEINIICTIINNV
jgi:CDP-6-deoxy-D-xylo-4-hexulose-3-dehydrase